MIINKLKLHNFGVYASDNEFDFKSDKPVVLIGGLNGRGKTTFLEAVLLALYGSESFAYKESKYTSYGRYLYNHVNRADQTLESFVELDFSLDGDRYIVQRKWDGTKQRVHEKITVLKNDQFDQFLTDNWPMFIENVLPSGLAKFFFFDGEKIATLAENDTSSEMKDAIRAMLGITVLDNLRKDLKRMITRTSKYVVTQSERDELEKLRKNKEASRKALASLDHEKKMTESEQDAVKKELEELHTEYVAAGGEVVEKRQELIKQKEVLSTKDQDISHSQAELAAGDLPLNMVGELLRDIKIQSELEIEDKSKRSALIQIKKAYNAFSESNETDEISDQFIRYFEEGVKSNQEKSIYNLSSEQVYHLNTLMSHSLESQKDEAQNTIEAKESINNKLKTIDQQLSVEIDERRISEIHKKIKDCEKKQYVLKGKLETLSNQRSTLNGSAMHDHAKFNNFVEKIIGKLEKNDENERLIKYVHYAQNILDQYEERLQARKVNVLAQTMTSCYKKLASKKNMIDYIKMDPATLDFNYYNNENQEIPKSSLSAGEKQLMIISLLWALAICSKKKLPVIIDTPLSRLDSEHRTSLIKRYFPNASEQTIILSTDSEIGPHYYKMMKEYVGDEFLLKYNDEMKNTIISRGYFGEEK